MQKRENNNMAKASYKTLAAILKRNGVERIEMNLSDLIPFTKYISKNIAEKKIYIATIKGKAVFSTVPLASTENKKEETNYQNIISK